MCTPKFVVAALFFLIVFYRQPSWALPPAAAARYHAAVLAGEGASPPTEQRALLDAENEPLADGERLPATEALSLVQVTACDEVFDDDSHAHAQCLELLRDLQMTPALPTTEQAFASSSAQDSCCVLRGYLRARLPACVDALALYLRSLRDNDDQLADHAMALGATTCHPQTLCGGEHGPA